MRGNRRADNLKDIRLNLVSQSAPHYNAHCRTLQEFRQREVKEARKKRNEGLKGYKSKIVVWKKRKKNGKRNV